MFKLGNKIALGALLVLGIISIISIAIYRDEETSVELAPSLVVDEFLNTCKGLEVWNEDLEKYDVVRFPESTLSECPDYFYTDLNDDGKNDLVLPTRQFASNLNYRVWIYNAHNGVFRYNNDFAAIGPPYFESGFLHVIAREGGDSWITITLRWEDNRFVIINESLDLPKGKLLTGAALQYCQERDLEIGEALELNFDNDSEKEIVATCGEGGFGGHLVLVVLDDILTGAKELLREENLADVMRQFAFDGLQVEDIDKDGVDEIIHRSAGWSAYLAVSSVHLFSPKFKEWFEVSERLEGDLESGRENKTINFSDNFDRNNMTQRIFMGKSLEVLEQWDTRPSRWSRSLW